MKRLGFLALLLLGGCVHTSVMQLDARTVEVTVSGAPICGDTGTQQVAYQDAAIATLRAGFDGFVIVGNGERDSLAGVVVTPTTASTTTQGNVNISSAGNMSTGTLSSTSSTVFSGGSAIPLFLHKDQIVVRMFRANDPDYAQAVPARTVLGPKWADKVTNGPASTC